MFLSGKTACFVSILLIHTHPHTQKWKKRYFVLSRTNPFDPLSAELTYYDDQEKRHKKGTIDLSTIVNVNPIHKSNKEHIFSLEAPGRSYLLKAADARAKNLWVAKLLECCSKGTSYTNVIITFVTTFLQ